MGVLPCVRRSLEVSDGENSQPSRKTKIKQQGNKKKRRRIPTIGGKAEIKDQETPKNSLKNRGKKKKKLWL